MATTKIEAVRDIGVTVVIGVIIVFMCILGLRGCEATQETKKQVIESGGVWLGNGHFVMYPSEKETP